MDFKRQIQAVSKAQSEFVLWKPKADWGEILFSGGYGSGKSFSLAMWVLKYLSYPNTDIAMGRLAAVDMKRSTWATLTEPWDTPDGKTHPPLIPAGAIKKTDTINNCVHFYNGSTIHFLGLEDIEKNRSRNFHCGIGEEISELSENQFTTFTSRIRKIHPLGNVVACASNAVPKHHWIYRHFILSAVKGEVECFISPTTDNKKNLPEGYIKRLERLPPKERERFLQGLFVSDGDTVFYCFNPDTHVVNKCPFVPDGYIVSQDFGGGSGMSAAHLIAYKKDEGCGLQMHIADEFIMHRARHTDLFAWMKGHKELTNHVVYDGANAAIRNDMVSLGWQCYKGIKNLADSYITVNSGFTENRLTIAAECGTLINQLQGAEYEKGTDKTEKRTGWDAIDSARYGVCFLDRTSFCQSTYEFACFDSEETATEGKETDGSKAGSETLEETDSYGWEAGEDFDKRANEYGEYGEYNGNRIGNLSDDF